MGQVTLPVLNRKGYSNVWENHWESKFAYSTQISEDIFFKNFFKIFLQNWLSSEENFFKKNLNKSNIADLKKKRYKKYFNIEKKNISNKEILDFLKNTKNKRFPHYVSKTFIVRYANWIILYMYVYIPRAWYIRLSSRITKRYTYRYTYDLYKYQINKLNFFQ